MAELGHLAAKMAQIAQGVDSPRVVRAAGMAAKNATLDVASDVAGSDRRLSGWGRRGGVRLGVGFDEAPGQVTLALRPAGIWTVLEQGRRGGKTVNPRSRGGARALATPYGPRRSVQLGRTAGKQAVTRSANDGSRAAGRAASHEVTRIMREVF